LFYFPDTEGNLDTLLLIKFATLITYETMKGAACMLLE